MVWELLTNPIAIDAAAAGVADWGLVSHRLWSMHASRSPVSWLEHAGTQARRPCQQLEVFLPICPRHAMQVLVRYIDEVQACVLDARSAAAALCKPVPRAEKVGPGRGQLGCPHASTGHVAGCAVRAVSAPPCGCSTRAPLPMLLPSNLNPPVLQEALARALGALPQDAFELAVGLVMAHHPGLQPYDDFGFDLDALDALTLRQMQVGGGILHARNAVGGL